MNVKTDTLQETFSTESLESELGFAVPSGIAVDHGVQDRRQAGGRRSWTWLAVGALAASLAIGGAVVALDDSSEADTVSTIVNPERDNDFHREPAQSSSSELVNPERDRPEPGQSTSDVTDKPDGYGSGLPHEAH